MLYPCRESNPILSDPVMGRDTPRLPVFKFKWLNKKILSTNCQSEHGPTNYQTQCFHCSGSAKFVTKSNNNILRR